MTILRQQWFLICLIACFVIGILYDQQLEGVARSAFFRQALLALVMFLMAWPLETSRVVRTILQPWPALFASAINLGLIPLLAKPLSLAQSPELATGLIVAAAAPCTLASAAVWTRRGGGNDAVAMMTTIITNGLCFVITPLWIILLAGRSSVQLSWSDMMLRLLLLVLLPMVVAQLSRVSRPVARTATLHKEWLGAMAQIGVLVMVTIGAVEMGLRMAEGIPFAWRELIWLALACLVLHFGGLFSGYQLSKRLRFGRAEQIAVAFSCSQKTLMVGLVLCLQLGVSILPIVLFHAVQLIGDTPIADWFRQSSQVPKA